MHPYRELAQFVEIAATSYEAIRNSSTVELIRHQGTTSSVNPHTVNPDTESGYSKSASGLPPDCLRIAPDTQKSCTFACGWRKRKGTKGSFSPQALALALLLAQPMEKVEPHREVTLPIAMGATTRATRAATRGQAGRLVGSPNTGRVSSSRLPSHTSRTIPGLVAPSVSRDPLVQARPKLTIGPS